MMDARVDDLDESETGRGGYSHKLSNPTHFLWTMIIFLILVGFVAAILYRQAHTAFMANPGLNGFILGVLIIGIVLVFNQVISLIPEVRWFNASRAAGDADKVGRDPRLLAPMRSVIGRRRAMTLSPSSQRSILDSIGTRLDESREISRYLIGLLVFLGLLGTFWGLIETIGSISGVIQSLDAGSSGDVNDLLATIKSGLTAPLSGMGTAFSSSLLGLSGSLILGFLDIQAGRAQNRFHMELENWLSSVTDMDSDAMPKITQTAAMGSSEELRALTEQLRKLAAAQVKAQDSTLNEKSLSAMANLAEGIQGLVKNMRNEQQMLRDWIEAQQEEAKILRRTLDRLSEKIGSK
jgi:hypothetical protein